MSIVGTVRDWNEVRHFQKERANDEMGFGRRKTFLGVLLYCCVVRKHGVQGKLKIGSIFSVDPESILLGGCF